MFYYSDGELTSTPGWSSRDRHWKVGRQLGIARQLGHTCFTVFSNEQDFSFLKVVFGGAGMSERLDQQFPNREILLPGNVGPCLGMVLVVSNGGLEGGSQGCHNSQSSDL